MNLDPSTPQLGDGRRPVVDRSAQRNRLRHRMQPLVYVTLDHGNGGILHDLSEEGLAVQAVAPLRPHQAVRIRFELPTPKTRVEATGQVAWANSAGQAGIQFTQIERRTRSLLKDWLLNNLLATASYATSAIFAEQNQPGEHAVLTFSPQVRPAIPLQADRAGGLGQDPADVALQLPWWPVPMTARTLSGLVDGLILLASDLLFCLVFLSISHQVPSWLVSIAAALGVTSALCGIYWFLFVVVRGSETPGWLLARIAAGDSEMDSSRDLETTRFR